MAFTLPDLPYAYDALAKSIDPTTMEIHHGKHHGGYVSKLNAAVEGTEFADMDLAALQGKISSAPAGARNNGGGHFNHSLFWTVMGPNGGGSPSGDLATAIDGAFGSFDAFKEAFGKEAATRFGSGWAWLVVDGGTLKVGSTPNQDNPLMDVDVPVKGTPILGLDVWEHAYYLKYQNKRPEYIAAFWDVVDWSAVAERFAAAK